MAKGRGHGAVDMPEGASKRLRPSLSNGHVALAAAFPVGCACFSLSSCAPCLALQNHCNKRGRGWFRFGTERLGAVKPGAHSSTSTSATAKSQDRKKGPMGEVLSCDKDAGCPRGVACWVCVFCGVALCHLAPSLAAKALCSCLLMSTYNKSKIWPPITTQSSLGRISARFPTPPSFPVFTKKPCTQTTRPAAFISASPPPVGPEPGSRFLRTIGHFEYSKANKKRPLGPY